MTDLVTQPSSAPTRKVSAASLAALGGSFLVDAVEHYGGSLPETAEPFLVALLVFVAGYVVRERDSPASSGT